MSSLLSKARVKLKNAKSDYVFIGHDDGYLDDCCFNLQQAIELTLKYVIKENGESFIENHDLRAQLNKLKAMKIDVPDKDRLRILAPIITDWEAKSRYLENFTEVIENVDEVLEMPFLNSFPIKIFMQSFHRSICKSNRIRFANAFLVCQFFLENICKDALQAKF